MSGLRSKSLLNRFSVPLLPKPQFLDFPQILSMWLSKIVAALWRSPWAVICPTPSALQAARSRRLNARLENGAPEYGCF